jgi:excisionase family DNA binding protein
VNRKSKVQQATPEPVGEILNDPQCAAVLGVTRRTLRLWRRTRGLPFCKITSREIRYRRTDIYAWLEQRRVAMVAA